MNGWRLKPRMAAGLLAGLVLVGCGVEAGDRAKPAGGAGSTNTSTAEPLPPTDEALSGDELLDRVRPSVALVETPQATGSAVLIEDGYLVTNLHVINPFDQVDLAFEDGEELDDVPVVGVDLIADLAVLGPVEVDRPPLAFADAGADGADVFLVGFPGDQDEPDAVITDGVVSRRKEAEGWDLEYLVSDADIAPGQSGGAMLDDRGQVVGISSLSDEDDFSYALTAEDVEVAVADIVDGGGSTEWEPRPEVGMRDTYARSLEPDAPPTRWLVTSDDEAVDVEITVEGPEPQVVVADPGYASSPWTANQAALDDEDSWFQLEDAEPLDEVQPDTWSFELEAGMDAIVELTSKPGGSYRIISSQPMQEVADTELRGSLEVGEPERDAVDYLEDWAVYLVDLEAGTSYEVTASAASGDMEWNLFPDDPDNDESWEGTDGGGGLLDVDASEVVTPTESGLYYLSVFEYEASPTLFEVSVTER